MFDDNMKGSDEYEPEDGIAVVVSPRLALDQLVLPVLLLVFIDVLLALLDVVVYQVDLLFLLAAQA